MGGHGPPAEIDVRQVLVVRPTEKGDPVRGVVAAQGEGVAMVVLEPVAGRAAPALLIHESATASVPLVHGPANGSRDVAGGRLYLCFREALARGDEEEARAISIREMELIRTKLGLATQSRGMTT